MPEREGHQKSLILGKDLTSGLDVSIPIDSLRKHIAIFGQTGSGKTVACKVVVEEAVRNNIPVIILDIKGDISSLAMLEDYKNLEQYGISEEFHNEFKDKIEVVIFTPASEKGIPLSINPLIMPPEELDREEKILAIDGIATNLANLLGYKIGRVKGDSVKAYLISFFEHCLKKDIHITSLDMLVTLLQVEDKVLAEAARSMITDGEKNSLIKRIKAKTVGASSLVFSLGPQLSIPTLITPSNPEKTRVAIIFLNTLTSQKLKELYISTLAQNIYTYLRSNPSPDPQLIFYIDELAGPPQLIPPHPKDPPTKQWLQLLFKQGRALGLSMLVATQNVSDVDYKAFGQVSTFLFGRFVAPQDLKIIDRMLQSNAEARFIVGKLRKFNPGEFYLLSPDNFPEPVRMHTRRLYTIHETLSAENISRMYANPTPIMTKQVGEYDRDIDAIDLDDIEKEITLEDLEKDLNKIKRLSSTPSLLDKQAGIDEDQLASFPTVDISKDEEKFSQKTDEQQIVTTSESLKDDTVIEKLDFSKTFQEKREQFLKYEPADFRDLLSKFFAEQKISYLGTNNLSLAYIPFLYVEFRINAKRKVNLTIADTEKQKEIALALPIKRVFPLIDEIRFEDNEKIWGQSSIAIQSEEVFEEILSILPMKNLGSLVSAPSSTIDRLTIQRQPARILASFHDIILNDQTFYINEWKKLIESKLSSFEREHEKEIKEWLRNLEKERGDIFSDILTKRKKAKKFQAQIEEAKSIYATLKPVMEDKFAFRGSRDVTSYNKAVEKIKFGPEVIQNYVKDVETGISRIKAIDELKESIPRVKLIDEINLIVSRRDFCLPKASEIKDIYTTFIYIPVSISEISIADKRGNKLNLHGIAESALGTKMSLVCDICFGKHSDKMLFVSDSNVCSVCGKVLCQDHTIHCSYSKNIICPDHAIVCSTCKNVISTEFSKKCYFCDKMICTEHLQKCSTCNKVVCVQHAKKEEKKSLFKTETVLLCPDHSKRK